MKREVHITVEEVEGGFSGCCRADGEEWAQVFCGTQNETVNTLLHYALVHLSEPKTRFDELLERAQ